ncbi:MAG: TonB family protein [Prevotellaceae bacterium]|jgi:protein TonB|nr:TonB family protein [Prevotellaceae bacterium]
MGKDIKLNSSEWCDVVFEGKNQRYGAYRLRRSSSKRHIVAFLVILAVVIVIALLPALISAVEALIPARTAGVEETYTMTDVNQTPEENLVEEAIKKVEETPPPELKSTVQFVVPKIRPDDEVDDNQEMKSQTDLQETQIQISVADIKGKDDDTGVDIATLREHEAITEARKTEIFRKVEQMPAFPGGEAEMYAYLRKNLIYPVMAQEAGIQGRVTVQFVITPEGDVSKVEVIGPLHPSCDREAIRLISSMPKWTPGRQQGRAVYVYYSIPVVFRLE